MKTDNDTKIATLALTLLAATAFGCRARDHESSLTIELPDGVQRVDSARDAKPSAPVTFAYEFVGDAEIGRELEIRVTVEALDDLDDVRLTIDSDDAGTLEIVAGENAAALGNVSKGQTLTESIRVLPRATKHADVRVALLGIRRGRDNSSDATVAKSLSIPLPLGPRAVRALETKVDREAGELVVGQAVETVR